MYSDKNLEYLSTVIDRIIFDVITAYIRSQRKEIQRKLIQIFCTFIELLRQPINSRNTTQLAENLEYIRSYFCDKHTYNTAESKYNTLLALIKYLIKQGIFAKSPSMPKRLSKTGEYDLYKRDIIPISVLKKIKVYPSAKEIFDNTIDKLCPPEIAKRLKEHVNTFKNKKHHRAPILQFILQISAENPEWYNHPKIIQGGLLKFRNSLLNSKQRNTSYGNYQNVKNSIEVLIEHHLLSSEIELPGNLRRCTNAAKIRDSNPIISEFNIYEDHNRLKFRNSQEFLKDLENDIRENLNILITEAATIIQESYKIFLSKKEIVKKSQQQEFINHPRMRVQRNTNQKTVKKELNPFYSTHPLCFENKVAALDHFLELVAHKKEIPNSAQLNGKPELYKYLGLTPLVASAMQIVIVEELGINPHSLYNIKVNSDGHGLEYVKETDQGDVRLKAIKPRARMARTMQANGTLVRLSEQEACMLNCVQI
ncbi:MAG: hypothetical protein Q7L19_15785 [Pseudohongiella sp.]|nr:hypothetical protein [Pseudohongiella sp.]